MQQAEGNTPGTWQLTHPEHAVPTAVLTLHVTEALGKLVSLRVSLASNKILGSCSLIYVCIR